MRKYLLLLLPAVAILLAACSKGYSLEYMNASYVSKKDQIDEPNPNPIVPEDQVIDAEGGKLYCVVSSTHSYVLSADPSGICDFVNNGVVKYSQEGVAIIDIKHEVSVNPNNTESGRVVRIVATQRRNSQMVASLMYYQPTTGAIKAQYITNQDQGVAAEGETIRFKVLSTHSYVLTANPSDACTFENNGEVTINDEGRELNERVHEVTITPNTTGEVREIHITATLKNKENISDKENHTIDLVYYQPAQGAE